jgi:hypothetical protein
MCVAVLHNVIIGADKTSLKATIFNSAYNATLCNTAWGKNYRRKSRSVRVIAPITVTVIFASVGMECNKPNFQSFANINSVIPETYSSAVFLKILW